MIIKIVILTVIIILLIFINDNDNNDVNTGKDIKCFLCYDIMQVDFPQKDTIMQTILDPYPSLSRSLLGAVQIS